MRRQRIHLDRSSALGTATSQSDAQQGVRAAGAALQLARQREAIERGAAAVVPLGDEWREAAQRATSVCDAG